MTGQRRWRGRGEVRRRMWMVLRKRSWIAALAVPLVLAGGCGGERGPAPGADPAKVGPQAGPGAAQAAAPDVVSSQPSPTAAASPMSAAAAAAQALKPVLAQALISVDSAAAYDVKVDAGQLTGKTLVVEWTISKDPDDATAKTRLRPEVVAVLAAAKPHMSSYDAVMLLVDATVRNSAGRPVGVRALRAMYSRALIERTNFATLSVDPILTLPDDKSKRTVIDPAFR